jgi:hypothetical protein
MVSSQVRFSAAQRACQALAVGCRRSRLRCQQRDAVRAHALAAHLVHRGRAAFEPPGHEQREAHGDDGHQQVADQDRGELAAEAAVGGEHGLNEVAAMQAGSL